MVHRKIPGLYSFVKLLCRTLFHIFFRDYAAFHTGTIPDDEPLLVISNHGNYLLDGLALLATYPGQISFLMAQPNFKTAIGGIAKKIGAIPVLRPQDAPHYDGISMATIAKDGGSITGLGIGEQLHVGDTVYIECGTFKDASKDTRTTQCYAVVETIISENEVAFKAPGLKWIPATLTSERDTAYIKSHKIVRRGSLEIRVQRGNTFVGIQEALDQMNGGNNMASSATGTIGRFVQNLFSKSPETSPDLERLMGDAHTSGSYTGADIPGSVTAPANFHTTETTPLIPKRSQSMNTTNQHPIYSAWRANDSSARFSSFSTTHSSNALKDGDHEEELVSNGLHGTQVQGYTNGYGHALPSNGRSQLGPAAFARSESASGSSSQPTPAPFNSAVVSPPSSISPAPSGPNSAAGTTVLRFPTEPCSFQFSNPIDHSMIYESVWNNFEDRRTVAVFPEGVSSDDYHLLDFKYGCTIMVLGYLAQHPSKTLRIIPCGLNFFNRHRFRSRFYADYGPPLTVPDHLVEMYKVGGDSKKQACTELLQIIHAAVEGLTLNAANYDELRLIKATRRLYSTNMKLTLPQKLELTRRFAKAYTQQQVLMQTEAMMSLKRDIMAYDKTLSHAGVRDSQLTANPSLLTALVCILPGLLLLPVLFLISLPGTLLFGPVGLLATWAAKKKGAQAMLAFQSYLPVTRWPGRDVIATWKIVVSLALTPICFLTYATIMTVLVKNHHLLEWIFSPETLNRTGTAKILTVFWFLCTFVFLPTVAFGTVWIWEWQIALKMQIYIWWWKLCGGNARMKGWRQDLVNRLPELIERMGGRQAFDVSYHH
ncbi:glycerol-3-phosphate O-acyltransferase / dihydroxyacetone phosphate acyltransferase [Entomortierella parvispora]|uniref:Glycerol-3-phosphate O-acyltransferase / dihydroxyacetone phosphate acyltransferase n=1 Tax=Entomortierella parvispora TaxID=205924 RepID=A0A9P3LY34_9FUNG|nr:glycerol-3-phosphate O-acyltransferase / dihydroxyacetone phosphate acyltransferase [Entomortierella parvispora]